MIYFAERDGLIKIGCSRNPGQRCAQLKARPLGTTEGGFYEERQVRARFSRFRIEGEWFSDSPEIRDYIRENCGPDIPKPLFGRQIRIPEELDLQIRERADKHDRRMTAEMRVLLRYALDMIEKTGGNP